MNDKIKEMLSKYKTIAMVGVSKDQTKASTNVMKYMQKYGYKVIPVNPNHSENFIHGEKVYGSLMDIKEKVDIVDVFRPSEEVEEIAKQTIKIGANVFGYSWNQKQ